MKRSTRTVLLVACVLAVATVGGRYSASATAQPAKVAPGGGDDLRAMYVNSADVADGKRLADASCVSCHGLNGVSTAPGVPHLAGQRPAYLHLELRAYQSGTRGDNAMGGAVKFLSDDALAKVAAYYASLEPPQPGTAIGGKAAPARTDPVQAGKAAAAACGSCHGEAGISKISGMPSLVGLDPNYLVAAMNAYKSGQRKNDMMKSLVVALSDADLSNLALYYALQKPARAQTPAPGDPAAGKARAEELCAGCHGEKGVSTIPANPSLAGQDAQYHAAALRAYKDGSRTHETMKSLVATLDDAGIKNLTAYYAAQQPQPAKVRKPLSVAEWAQRCDRCHGIDGNSTDPRLPALAAQRVDYLEKVLHAYRTGARRSSQMAAMSDMLTASDVESLAAHYARQKARAVIFVMVPAK